MPQPEVNVPEFSLPIDLENLQKYLVFELAWQPMGTEGRWSVTQEFLAYAIRRQNDDRVSEKLFSNRPSSLRPHVLL